MDTTNPNVELAAEYTFVVDTENVDKVIGALELRKQIGPFPFRVNVNDNLVTFLNATEVSYFTTGYRMLGRFHH